jgi:hypothetical protein
MKLRIVKNVATERFRVEFLSIFGWRPVSNRTHLRSSEARMEKVGMEQDWNARTAWTEVVE